MANASLETGRIRPGPVRRGNTFWKQFNKSKFLLLLFAPAFVWYLIFEYAPMFGALIAFKDYNLFKGMWASEWVGVKYFRMFFDNPDFFLLIKNTFLLSFYSLLFSYPTPIILALLLNEVKNTFFRRFVQTVSYLPHFISTVVKVSMIVMLLSPTTGLVNYILTQFGIEPIYFLAKPEWFRTVYISSGIWHGIGWGAIIYLAALATVDPHLYEAAEMDGASRWRKMFHISIPGIMPVTVILLIMNMGGLFSVGFEKVFLLSNPLTYETSDVISTYTYRTGLVQGNFSYATAIGLFNSLISTTLVFGANAIAKKVRGISLW